MVTFVSPLLLGLVHWQVFVVNLVWAANSGKPDLPRIWDQTDLDDQSESMGSYRIHSEVHLDDVDNNNKESFIMEEWLDGPSQLFRLDVESQQTTTASMRRRKTVLVRAGTRERFFYEPFRCKSITNLSGVLEPSLAEKFPQDEHDLALGGLGALWLHALNIGRPLEYKPAKLLPAPEDGAGRPKRSWARVMGTFDQFLMNETDKFPFRVKFYFAPNEWSELDGRQNPSALFAVHLIEPKNSKVVMNARIISIDAGPQAATKKDKSADLFELPLGYGCSRASTKSLYGDIKYKPPANCFGTQQPHVCNLQVVAWLPSDHQADMDKWKVRTSSLRFVSGQLQDRSYVTIEARDFEPASSSTATNKTTTTQVATRSVVRRTKRIWDLGSSQDYSQRGKPMYFELSEHLRVCRAYGQAGLNELPTFEFPLLLPPNDSDNNNNNNNNNKSSGSQQSKGSTTKLVGLSLVDEAMLNDFFLDSTGYHLVRDSSANWLKYRAFREEKRVEQFALRDQSGQVAWLGPVSLVRKFYYVYGEQTTLMGLDKTRTSAEAQHVHLTIYLFTHNYEQQLARIRLTMSPGQLINEAYLHRELNIGPCLQVVAANGRRLPIGGVAGTQLTTSPRDSLSFTLIYPRDSEARQVELEQYGEVIYAKFLAALLERVLATSSNNNNNNSLVQLSLLQVTNLKVDVEPDLVKVSATLNKWPEVFNYMKRPAVRTRESAHRKVLISELKANAELCAQSCSHYQCPLFVYNHKSRVCQLFEETRMRNPSGPSGDGSMLMVFEPDANCTVFERKTQDLHRPLSHASPQMVVDAMRELLLVSSNDDDDDHDDDEENNRHNKHNATHPLALELDLEYEEDRTVGHLVLLPDSLRLDNEAFSRLLQDDNPLQLSPDTGQEVQVAGQSTRPILAEYEILFRKRKFEPENVHLHPWKDFPVEEANHMSQEDCDQLCLEHDCKSYSYCQVERTCLVSQLHTEKDIELASLEEDFCMVFARDYLSKFHKIQGAVRGETLLALAASNNRLKSLRLNSVRDCAIGCMQWEDFTCRSFYSCPANGMARDGLDCFMSGDRQRPREHSVAYLQSNEQPTTSPSNQTALAPPDCDLYQRSHLVDYHQYHGKQVVLAPAAKSQQRQRLLIGLDAESCASECSQVDDQDELEKSSCRAFHVCLNSPNKGKRRQLICALLLDRYDAEETPTANAVSELLVDGSKCTAFVAFNVRRPGSYASGGGGGGGRGGVGSAEVVSDSWSMSGFMLSLVVIMLGLAIGYTLAWLFALQNFVIYPASCSSINVLARLQSRRNRHQSS